jgi:hypothetical protein
MGHGFMQPGRAATTAAEIATMPGCSDVRADPACRTRGGLSSRMPSMLAADPIQPIVRYG